MYQELESRNICVCVHVLGQKYMCVCAQNKHHWDVFWLRNFQPSKNQQEVATISLLMHGNDDINGEI